MVTLETAEKALKTVYLGVVADQLNIGVNPFMSKIKQTSGDVWGKEIVKLVPYGVNGGIGAGTETGDLPSPAANNFDRFKLELKNLYGTIEISDKAVRASQSNAGAFVNLLNSEMDGLLKASKFNLGRMLFGDGSGKIAKCKATAVNAAAIKVDTVKNLMEGLVIDFYSAATNTIITAYKGARIISVDRSANAIVIDRQLSVALAVNDFITVQGSLNNELTGLEAIFSDSSTLYGLEREGRGWLQPKIITNFGPITSAKMQEAVDEAEIYAGSAVDYLLCSYDVRRDYLDYLSYSRINYDFVNLEGGFKAICYNGIPLVADRFVEPEAMYFLNSADFKLHQLCDWRWLEGDGGRIIKQKAGTPTYTATLVKYADMICDRPMGQVKATGITA